METGARSNGSWKARSHKGWPSLLLCLAVLALSMYALSCGSPVTAKAVEGKWTSRYFEGELILNCMRMANTKSISLVLIWDWSRFLRKITLARGQSMAGG